MGVLEKGDYEIRENLLDGRNARSTSARLAALTRAAETSVCRVRVAARARLRASRRTESKRSPAAVDGDDSSRADRVRTTIKALCRYCSLREDRIETET
jgi:hypothetical protein